ncbi:hypothetical protein [Actinoplanes sp. NPDC051851]|uniref:hypothetical protein n=1 Tax=Actinoplanes sp. NPDC051851 TaxID=3154753 RepID=UPI003420B59B
MLGLTGMRASVVWWDLTGSDQTIETLRAYVHDESVAAFSQVPGLAFKMWISDPESNRWGAVLLWESAEAARQPLPSRALELIGHPPMLAEGFDVDATFFGGARGTAA